MTKTPHHASETPQICYSMAYRILPSKAFRQSEEFLRLLGLPGPVGAVNYYVLTCELLNKEPRTDVCQSLTVQSGSLNDAEDFYVVEFPTPPEVDVSGLPRDQMMDAMKKVVLAPYFSAAIVNRENGKLIKYLVLGQSPNGKTTLRSVTLEENARIGEGCEPTLDAFVAALREMV